ncbi:MAG: hypothetical protein ACSLFI_12930, partial [Solirubrobacterales bacterium]
MKPFLARLVPVLVLPVLLLLPAQPADAARLLPPKGKVLTGVSDNGTLQGFRNYTRATGKHPAVLQTFHPWGNKLELAYRRWQNAKVVPMLHISTADDETREELITPQEIATGAGDPYLWKMNRFFAEKKQRAYIRPLGEPNRCLNPYSAVTCSGTPRGGEHTQRWYRKAFQRIAVIVRGGMRTKMVNRKLWKLGMPNIKWGKAKKPEFMPKPKVAIVWSPLPAGSPMAPGNWPANYWPGKDFVDWAGTDFYSNYPFWEDLNRFMDGQPWRNKPVAMSEWGVTGYDDTRFVHRIFRWMKENPRVRMMNYYRGFGSSDPY